MRQSKHNSAPQISDFSEALLNAGSSASAGATGNYEDELHAMLNQDSPTAGNSNLSNELNKIRDRGPAGKAGRQKRRAAQQRNQEDVVTRFSSQARASAEQEQTARVSATESDQSTGSNVQHTHTIAALWASKDLRQQLPMIFMLVAILALAAMQFHTDRSLSQLASTQQFGEQGNELSINTALQSQQQIVQLQTTITALSDKLEQLDNKLASQSAQPPAPQLLDSLSKLEQKLETVSRQQQDSIAALKKQVAVLHESNAMVAAKSSEKTGASNKSAAHASASAKAVSTAKVPAKASSKKSPASKVQSQPRWSVNLAALSNRQLARKAMQRLKGAGVSPMIEEIELKGKKVYRLSVDGFASKQAARKFVNKARHYGFEKGWIRKG